MILTTNKFITKKTGTRYFPQKKYRKYKIGVSFLADIKNTKLNVFRKEVNFLSNSVCILIREIWVLS